MRNRKRKRVLFPALLLGCFGLFLVIGFNEDRLSRYHSPGELVEAVVRAYQSQNNTLLKACYGKSSEQLEGDKEINFQKKFYLSVDASDVKINKTEKLLSMGDYYCMGVSFDFLLGGRKPLPYYEYYFVHKTDGNYKVLTKLECPRALMDAFEGKKDNMQKSDLYRKYEKQTKEFTSGNPSSAEQIYGRFQDLLEGPPVEMVKNLRLVCGIFLMAIAELGIVCALIYLFRLKKRLQNTVRPLTGKSKSRRNRISEKADGRRFRSNALKRVGKSAAAASRRRPLHTHKAGRRQSSTRSGRTAIFDSRKDNIPHTGTHA